MITLEDLAATLLAEFFGEWLGERPYMACALPMDGKAPPRKPAQALRETLRQVCALADDVPQLTDQQLGAGLPALATDAR